MTSLQTKYRWFPAEQWKLGRIVLYGLPFNQSKDRKHSALGATAAFGQNYAGNTQTRTHHAYVLGENVINQNLKYTLWLTLMSPNTSD